MCSLVVVLFVNLSLSLSRYFFLLNSDARGGVFNDRKTLAFCLFGWPFDDRVHARYIAHHRLLE